MARRKQIQLTTADRDAVANGLRTLAELSATYGCSRQSLHITFKRRGWPTRPIDLGAEPAASGYQEPVQGRRAFRASLPASTSQGDPRPSHAPAIAHSETGTPAASADEPTLSAARSAGDVPTSVDRAAEVHEEIVAGPPAERQEPCSAPPTSTAGPAPSAPPGASAAPLKDDLGGIEITAENIADYARQAAAAVALAALDRAHEILSQPVGATALKAAIGAAALAIDQLARVGLSIDAEVQGVPQLTIREMTAKQQEEIQASVEAEYRGEISGELVDDAGEMDELPG